MIKTIFFDIGGVLITDPEKYMFADLALEFRKDYATLMKIRDKWIDKLVVAEITHREYWEGILKESGIEGDPKKFEQRIYEYLLEIYGMLDLVKSLKDKYKIGAISNHTIDWAKDMTKKYNLKSYFDDIVLSCDVKVAKPNPEIYKIALQRLNAKPEESLFIDNKESCLSPARKLGMKTVLFESREQLLEDLEKLGIKV